MPRLPLPGSDNGTWGTILNEYLSQIHKSDGSLKDDIITAAAIAPDTITAAEIMDGTILEAQLASSVQTKLNTVAPTWSTLSGKPAIIAAGADPRLARNAIGMGHIVTPEDFGAVGDGVTDDGEAFEALFEDYAINNGGAYVHIPTGKIYATSEPLIIPSNTSVFGGGTVKCISDTPGGRGAIVLMVNGVQNIRWDGPTIDGNGTVNANCIAIGTGIGFDPDTSPFNSDIYINATVKGARISAALEEDNDYLYSGGGKGFTIQGRSRNIYANIRSEDCDIAITVEAGSSEGREDGNIVIDAQSYNSHRTALLIYGTTPPGYGTLISGSYKHGLYPGCKIRLHALGGQDADVIDITDGIQKPNYELAGVVTCQAATGVDLEVYAAVEERCTLLRGKMFASRVKINAFMDNLQEVWDARTINGAGTIGTYMLDNELDVSVHTATHHGSLVRLAADTNHTRRSNIDISTFCENGIGPILSSEGTEEFGTSISYRFRDLKASPVKEIVGMSSVNPKPTWALANNGGRVAVQSESWPYMAWNEAPWVLGSAGVARRWVHWDNTNSILRLASSAPVADTSGNPLALHFLATATDGDTSPSVRNVSVLTTANTAATTITALDNGYVGQRVTIRFGDSNTTLVHSGSLRLAGAVNKTFVATDTVTFVQQTANGWTESGRANTSTVLPTPGTATLNFGQVTAQSFADLSITATGAVVGDCVSLGVPTEAVTAGIAYTAWVSAANTVTVRAHNYTAGPLDPASGVFKAAIVR